MATSSGKTPARKNGAAKGNELGEPLELLRQEIQRLGDRLENAAAPSQDPLPRHIRRYMPFYALATVWAMMLVFFPTTRGGDNNVATGSLSGTSQSQVETTTSGETFDTSSVTGDLTVPTQGATGTAVAGRVTSKAGPTVQKGVAAPQIGTGKTRAGFECKPGVGQFPISVYVAPCVSAFTGDNGGATTRGVTKDTIKIMRRKFPDSANSQAVEAFAQAAGAASSDVEAEVRAIFIDYFNKVYELYGRKVVVEEYETNNQANSTEEAQSRGKEGACIDATRVAEEFKAFASYSASGDQYSACSAERKTVVFDSAAYFPERFYRKYHPYLWNGVMECERISYQVVEYVGKRLAHRKAKWAGDPLYQTQERKFGTYVPNNDEYQYCVDISERELKNKYGVTPASRYNYTLDVSRFPDEAARGVVQFKAAGVTTLINACDPISTTIMTGAADSQNWHPEWYIIGVATQDVDSVARLYSQEQVAGHLFGMSQLGDTGDLIGPKSEVGKVYKLITGKEIPGNATGGYYTLVRMFNMLQAAGPILNVSNMDKGSHALPAGGAPTFPAGYASYQDGSDGTKGAGDHTAIDDGREVYWCSKCISNQDGKEGAYVVTYGGKRFRNNEWPAEEPPIKPS